MNNKKIRTWADVSLASIEYNYRQLRKTLPKTTAFLGVVKADAYGHGSIAVARRLEDVGADYLAVAFLDEAVTLRNAGITLPILVFGHTPPECAPLLADLELTQTVSDIDTANQMSALLADSDKRLKIHLKLNSGMGRLGADLANLDALKGINSLPGIDVEGVYTHFAVSDDPDEAFTVYQYRQFMEGVEKIERDNHCRFKIKHCANSGAVINYPYMHCDMVRLGLALYGIYPGAHNLAPAMELHTRIMHIFTAREGDSVSYGRIYTAKSPRTIAVLGIGYADGLPRILSGEMDMLVKGHRAPQVGRICMDMCMIDITDIPDCEIWDTVTVFGRNGSNFLPVSELSEKAHTIPYELVCAVSSRVPKIYHG